MTAMDIRTALTIGATLFSTGLTVGLLKADIRWIKHWMSEHRKDDAKDFENVRSELAELRALYFNHRPESTR